MKKLILGSQSPRRRDILNFFSIPFEQIAPDFDETQVSFQNDPVSFACEVAERKAIGLIERFPDSPILTADTIVFRDGRLFMKPETMQEASLMLSELAERIISSIPASAWRAAGNEFSRPKPPASFFTNSLTLRFVPITSGSTLSTKPEPMRSRAAAASLSKESRAAITTSWGCR
jgi:hypothetical protein